MHDLEALSLPLPALFFSLFLYPLLSFISFTLIDFYVFFSLQIPLCPFFSHRFSTSLLFLNVPSASHFFLSISPALLHHRNSSSHLATHAIYCTKGTILKARKEDLRKIWDGLGVAVHLHGCQGVGCNHPPSSNWVVRNVSRLFLGDGTEEEREEEWDRLEKNLNKWIYFPWSEEEVEGEEEGEKVE